MDRERHAVARTFIVVIAAVSINPRAPPAVVFGRTWSRPRFSNVIRHKSPRHRRVRRSSCYGVEWEMGGAMFRSMVAENHLRHDVGGGYRTDAYNSMYLYNKNTVADAHADLPQKKTLAVYYIEGALSLFHRPPIAHLPPSFGWPGPPPRQRRAAHACCTASSCAYVCKSFLATPGNRRPPDHFRKLKSPTPSPLPPTESPPPPDPCFSLWCHRRRVVVTLRRRRYSSLAVPPF